jgi:hypothetical protein
VAIRAVNWLIGYEFFRTSPNLTDDFRLDFFKSLLSHGRHILRNLEIHETPAGKLTANHYLSNLIGLLFLGAYLPEFKEAKQWLQFSKQELEHELFKQVYPDGVNFEASVSYHRLVTEIFLSSLIVPLKPGCEFSPAYSKQIEKMLEFILAITKPDGTIPTIGDNDNGRLFRLKIWEDKEREWVDHRYLLAIGAVLFGREDFALAAGDQWEEAIWLLGDKALTFKKILEAKTPPPVQVISRSFPHGGIYIMRQDDVYMAIDAGPVGQNGNGGHAHNDIFSFELYAFGQTWIVDPGMYVYTADYDSRYRYRSTAYHNTVVVGGQEQNDYSSRKPFSMSEQAEVKVIHWESLNEKDRLLAEHTGYNKQPSYAIHQREFVFDKQKLAFIINDHLICKKTIPSMEVYLHFAPGLVVKTSANDSGLQIYSEQTGMCLKVKWLADAVKCFEISSKEYAFGYGTKTYGKFARIIAHNVNLSLHLSFSQMPANNSEEI